jgi:hypothetical protein
VDGVPSKEICATLSITDSNLWVMLRRRVAPHLSRRLGLIDSNEKTIWIADAHRDDEKRFLVHADEKLSVFLELEFVIRTCGELA